METNLNNLIAGRPASVGRGSGYQGDTVRDVKARASTAEPSQSEQEKRGLRRLNSVLNNNEPLRDDVPRGYYLNINV
ncbi:MAG: hypothetical protein HQ483_11850 [Rhodospirillales bacterium]|nr:hypothetical protein [Rhodospirillales bacterium]